MSLKKEIGLLAGISILTGIMIGSGIFFFGTVVFGIASNSLGLSLLAWILGGAITLFSALTYAELGTMFPETGGYYVYLRKAFGKPIAFVSGWMNFFLSSSGSITTLSYLFSLILVQYVLGWNADYTRWVAALVIVVFGLVNYLGVRFGAWTQIVFTGAKLIPILLIIGLGLFLGTQTVDLNPIPVDVDPVTLFSGLTFAIARTLFAYEGWTNLNTVAGEMKNAQRDLPRALLISVLLVAGIYVLFILSLYRILDVGTLISQVANGVNNQTVFIAVFVALNADYSLWVMIAILISILGALNGTLLAFPRVYYAMGVDGTMPKVMNHTSPFQTPDVALLGTILVSLSLLFFDVDTLLTFVLFPALIFNTLIFFSVFKWRKEKPELPRPYRVWGYPWLPLFAIVGMVILLITTFVNSLVPSLIGTVVLLLGFAAYPFLFPKEKEAFYQSIRKALGFKNRAR